MRRIFELCALGSGKAAIAKRLNQEGAAHPHPQQGRVGGWCPSSVREVLYRETYRGVIVWNKTKKRDEDGREAVKDRPESEWMRVDAPQLRIVSDAQWKAAHDRLDNTRATYLRSNNGKLWGRPLNGTAAKYLGTGLLQCGCCGGTLEVRTRSHGRRRVTFYACSSYWRKGNAVCRNSAEVIMAGADEIILDTVEQALLHPAAIELAIRKTIGRVIDRGLDVETRRADLLAAIATTDAELVRLTGAIASGGDALASVLQAIGERETRKAMLTRGARDTRPSAGRGAGGPGHHQAADRRVARRVAGRHPQARSAGTIDVEEVVAEPDHGHARSARRCAWLPICGAGNRPKTAIWVAPGLSTQGGVPSGTSRLLHAHGVGAPGSLKSELTTAPAEKNAIMRAS